MRKVEYHGYTITEDARIFAKNGREIKQRFRNGRYEVRLTVDKERRSFSTARLVYYVFHPFDIEDRALCVTFRDGDAGNPHLDNLLLVHRKDLMHGENHALATLTDEDVEEIRRLYTGRTGVNQYDKAGYSMKNLADIYGVTKSAISSILRGRTRSKDNYKMK